MLSRQIYDQCKHGADAENTVQGRVFVVPTVIRLLFTSPEGKKLYERFWSLYSFLLSQPLHSHEQHQRAAKGHQRQDFKPAQGWNETISVKLDEKDDNYCCEYSQMVQ